MKHLIYFVSLLLFCSSCNNWLDLTPKGQIVDDDLFDKEIGYEEILTGVYNTMVDQAAYGTELTVGIPDAMAQYWHIISQSHELYDFTKFNLTTAKAEARLLATWSKMYEAIANLNILLERLESQDTLSLKKYNLLKGEALGLRAYLHLDLLRLFGPIIKTNPSGEAIPYRKEFSKNITSRLPANEVMNNIENDLLEAYNLLQDDPIKTVGRQDASHSGGEMAHYFRGIRMNYYAVAGTLARYYLLKNDNDKAYQYANEVIEANEIFKLLVRRELLTNKDLIFQSELVFALYDRNMYYRMGPVFFYGPESGKGKYTIPYSLITEATYRKDIYVGTGNGSSEDYRLQHWWKVIIATEALYKYYQDPDKKEVDRPHYPLLPMIRLTEMYYIAAEAKLGTDDNNKASRDLLNAVRKSRNLSALPEEMTSSADLLEQILAEIRKDSWGEGKLFYAYKRLNHDILTSGSPIPASPNVFVMPYPIAETDFGNN